jgi:small subunit ribosomal protein S4e
MLDFIHMDTGVNVMVTGGRNQGRSGVIVGRERHPGGFDICHVQDGLGRQFSTRLNNIFVIGDGGKPWISMPKGGGIKLSIAEERDQRRRQREAQGA